VCGRCEKPAPGYDTSPARKFDFIPFWGFVVFLIYARRRVQCPDCGIGAEKLPWSAGKQHSTQAHLLFLAAWARKLSWTEVALSFHSSWDRVHDAVEYGVEWGLQRRTLESFFAIGVDEIQYAKGHKYLTLVYQIDRECIRLLWLGKERTIESFRGLFAVIGDKVAAEILFVCSDMWKPYLDVIAEKCVNALNILDRFHVMVKMSKAIDEVRAAETKRLARDGYEPLVEEVALVRAQAQGEPHRQAAGPSSRSAQLQFADRPRLSIEGGLPSSSGPTTHRHGLASSSTSGVSKSCAAASSR
jgi:transposase